MRNQKVRTQFTYALGEGFSDVETPSSKSETIPGMALTVEQIMARIRSGQELTIQQPVYEGHLNLPDVRRMDKVEKEMFAREVRQSVKDLQDKLQQEKKEKHQKEVSDLKAELDQMKSQLAENVANPSPTLPDEKTQA